MGQVQIRYKTVWVISPAGIPVPTQVPYEYKIFHTKLENKGLETVIRKELDDDQWKRYKIFQETLGGRPYLFNGGLPPGGSDGSGGVRHRLHGSCRSPNRQRICRNLRGSQKSMSALPMSGAAVPPKPGSTAPATSAGSTIRLVMMWGGQLPTAYGTSARNLRSRSKAR